MMLRPKTWLAAARTAAGMGPPITTFAALPSVGSVPGQLRQLSDVNNIIVQARDIWRPYGGSQVLAMRTLNPVTVQSLSTIRAETIGPFPGGLVRTGMKLLLLLRVSHAGIGTAARGFTMRIGAPGSELSFNLNGNLTQSGASVMSQVLGTLDVLSDTSATHTGGTNQTPGFFIGNTNGPVNPVVDFSQPWSIALWMQSAAETAVNITGATWSAGVATYTCTAHTLVTGDKTVIAGVSPSGYNIAAGAIVTRIDNNTFSAPMAADPGAYVSGGTSSRISNMISQSYILTLEG